MISIDANILLYAANEDCPEQRRAEDFLCGLVDRSGVAISEFILVELYLLVRNPAVLKRPLNPEEATGLIASYRSHPSWMILGWPGGSLRIHDALWKEAGSHDFPRRKIIDLRTAMVLIEQGVREFATANVKDFTDVGFDRVWNPLD
jgi:uncharacterized protein